MLQYAALPPQEEKIIELFEMGCTDVLDWATHTTRGGGGKGSLAEQCKTGAGFLCSFFLCVRLVLRGGTALMGSKIVCNR